MISTRLKSLVKYINKDDSVIDIGCDHALLDVFLLKNNILSSITISDNKENALQAGKLNIIKNNLEKQVDIRLGNGLEVLTNEDNIDTIIISGMGTNSILKILNNNYLSKINKLIIQSNNDHYLLRKEIVKLGFYIKEEEYFKDKEKNYINIVFLRGHQRYKKNELIYGPYLIKDKKYLDFELDNINKLINLVSNNNKIINKLNKEKKLIEKLKHSLI